MELRKMGGDDLGAVSALGIRSKASWGYAAAEMEVFERELTLTDESLEELLDARVAVDGAVVGYFTLRLHPDGRLELEHLFVDPECFGRGIGIRLFGAALRSAADRGFGRVTIISDPNATEFYTKLGAQIVGEHESSISGRTIPVLSATGALSAAQRQ